MTSPSEAEWQTQLAGQTRLTVSANDALVMVEVVPGLVELEVAVPRSRPAVW
jgi:hypothetical protein